MYKPSEIVRCASYGHEPLNEKEPLYLMFQDVSVPYYVCTRCGLLYATEPIATPAMTASVAKAVYIKEPSKLKRSK